MAKLEVPVELAPLIQTLRDGSDWEAAVTQVTDQIERMSADDAHTLLLFALMMIALTQGETA